MIRRLNVQGALAHQPTPPAADLLRKAAGLEKGAAATKREMVGRVTRDQVREIAAIKMADLSAEQIQRYGL